MSAVVIFVWAVYNFANSKGTILCADGNVSRRHKFTCDVRRPNISGEGDWVFGGYASTGTFTGSMYHVSLQNLPGATGGNDYYNGKPGIGIDASRSSSIYKASSTVQPASVRLLACIKI